MAKGKLKGLFKKKEGGTLVGNLLRKVGDTVTGGVYSNIFPKPTASDVAKQAEKLGVSESTQLVKEIAEPANKANVSIDVNTGEKTPITKQKWFLPTVIGGALALVLGLVAIFKKKK